MLNLDLQIAVEETDSIPSASKFERWVELAIADYRQDAELTIRIVDKEESAELNSRYRHKQGPTNVLSFPASPSGHMPPGAPRFIGDLLIARGVLEREASEQAIPVRNHLMHLIVHGFLHLLGYDHETSETDALRMERLETAILARLGVPDPYADDPHPEHAEPASA